MINVKISRLKRTSGLVARHALAMALSASYILPSTAGVLPPSLEKDYRQDATLKVGKAAELYNRAAAAYLKGGPSAFVEVIPKRVFTPAQRTYVMKELGSFRPLPLAKVIGDKIVFSQDGKKILTADTYRFAQGYVEIDGKTYHYDYKKDFQGNYENWKTLNKQSRYEHLLDLILPRAEAYIASPGVMAAICGIILAILGAIFWPKIVAYFSPKQEAGADTHLNGATGGTSTGFGTGGPTNDTPEETKPAAAAAPPAADKPPEPAPEKKKAAHTVSIMSPDPTDKTKTPARLDTYFGLDESTRAKLKEWKLYQLGIWSAPENEDKKTAYNAFLGPILDKMIELSKTPPDTRIIETEYTAALQHFVIEVALDDTNKDKLKMLKSLY